MSLVKENNNLLSIRKVVGTVYNFDFNRNNYKLNDGEELITDGSLIDEFRTVFRLVDRDNGVIVTPSGYVRGLVYKRTNGGEVYNHPEWIPDIVSFRLNVLGIKKGSFYRVTVKGRNAEGSNLVTSDRTIEVTTSERDLLISEDFKKDRVNREASGIFRASSNEVDLYFKLGKVYLNDIIIEEVEIFLNEDSNESVDSNDTLVYGMGKKVVAAFGVFSTQPMQLDTEHKRYEAMHRYAGEGLNLYFDNINKEYIIERDNVNDIIGEPFTNVQYMIELNLNKVVNKNEFSQYNIVEVNPDVSPNTLKQGFIKFEFVDADDKRITYSKRDGRIYIIVYRFN